MITLDHFQPPQAWRTEALAADNSALATLLISEVVGRQYFFQKNHRLAAEWLQRATTADTPFFPHLMLHARVYLSASIADDAPAEALRLVEHAYSVVSDSPKSVLPLTRVTAAGELAIARRWLVGDMVGSFQRL